MAIINLLSFVNNTPWAMEKSALTSMISVLDGKLNNTEAYQFLVAMEQKTMFGQENSSDWEGSSFVSASGRTFDYMKLSGTMVPRTGSMKPMCGMLPSIAVAQLISQCTADTLIIHADSGGGSVMGTPELASAVAKLVDQGVEVIAYTDTQMASAMYWACSPATIIASKSAVIGSIGVYTVLTKNNDIEGKCTSSIIKAGDKKAYGDPNLPVSEEEINSIQSKIDSTYQTMCFEISGYRKCSLEDIIGTQADYYTASEAPSFLIDGIMTLEELLTKAKES